MDKLTLKQYREMVDKIRRFRKQNGEMPEHVIVDGYKINKREYIDMMERVNRFILEMGRSPRTVDIESPKEHEHECERLKKT